jgi:hypothetical protein
VLSLKRFSKNHIRNKKGNVLILEFVALIPLFFLLMVVVFDFLQLYTGIINMQLASQSAMSEIAFMGKNGEEGAVVGNAIKKANAIISYALDKDPNGLSHNIYTYSLIDNQNGIVYQNLNHFTQSSSMFMETSIDKYKDHNREIWGFDIKRKFTFQNSSMFNFTFAIDINATQYMGILKGIK